MKWGRLFALNVMKMSEKIILRLQPHCGRNWYYPENDAAYILLEFTRGGNKRRKALSEKDLKNLVRLGMDIDILYQKIDISYSKKE